MSEKIKKCIKCKRTITDNVKIPLCPRCRKELKQGGGAIGALALSGIGSIIFKKLKK